MDTLDSLAVLQGLATQNLVEQLLTRTAAMEPFLETVITYIRGILNPQHVGIWGPTTMVKYIHLVH